MGITVSHSAMLAHCHALTQACGYTEGEEDILHVPKYPLLHFSVFSPSFILMTWRKASS